MKPFTIPRYVSSNDDNVSVKTPWPAQGFFHRSRLSNADIADYEWLPGPLRGTPLAAARAFVLSAAAKATHDIKQTRHQTEEVTRLAK
jgi:hypothetical protein